MDHQIDHEDFNCEIRKIHEMHFRQNQQNPSNDPNGNSSQINSADYANSVKMKSACVHCVSLRTWRPLREENGRRAFSRFFPVAVRKDFYNFLPFFSVISNCLRAKCKGQFFTVVKTISAMSYPNTGQGNRKNIPSRMGGQILAKTSRQNIKNKGIFASIRPVSSICPFALIKMPWDRSRLS